MTLALGFAPIADGAISALPSSGPPPAYSPTIGCGNVATVGAVYIEPVPMVMQTFHPVSFGTIGMPFIDWAPVIGGFPVVTMGERMTAIRMTSGLRRVRARMRSFDAVKFGELTL